MKFPESAPSPLLTCIVFGRIGLSRELGQQPVKGQSFPMDRFPNLGYRDNVEVDSDLLKAFGFDGLKSR